MGKWTAILLVFIMFATGYPTQIPKARAIAVVVVAPEAAVAMLEALILACSAAAAIGVISEEANREYHAELQGKVDSIQDAVRKGSAATFDAVRSAVETIVTVNLLVRSPASCERLLRNSFSNISSRKTTDARSQASGECEPSLRSDPFKCCPHFMKKYSADNSMTPVGRFAFRIRYLAKHSVTRACCFEWDSLHGRFEVYQSSNHGPAKHRGEKSCAGDADLDEDLCNANHPEKADYFSERHAPRNGCP
ncbi:MAG: hypothetical protein COT73_05810 [Bdellovibrio sp. CG10_big_fil_rev_8_21_14_0_10_47_8]|nr:MAG: hypothetical protein COT73_05810 [Bdellovibrio sp. CG10_big_fil_rev_8_21_14_0_10_47_8]